MANNSMIKIKIKRPIVIERHRKTPLSKEEKRLLKEGKEDEAPADTNYSTIDGWRSFLNKI